MACASHFTALSVARGTADLRDSICRATIAAPSRREARLGHGRLEWRFIAVPSCLPPYAYFIVSPAQPSFTPPSSACLSMIAADDIDCRGCCYQPLHFCRFFAVLGADAACFRHADRRFQAGAGSYRHRAVDAALRAFWRLRPICRGRRVTRQRGARGRRCLNSRMSRPALSRRFPSQPLPAQQADVNAAASAPGLPRRARDASRRRRRFRAHVQRRISPGRPPI